MSDTKKLPCGECGASLVYEPGAGQLVCPFCGSKTLIEGGGQTNPWGVVQAANGAIREMDYQTAIGDTLEQADLEASQTIRCPGCGAQIELDDTTLADQCPFCATPMSREQSTIHHHPRAQAVLPFAIDARAARAAMTRWLGRLWFAPSSLRKYAEASRPLSGIYLPHYTYDAFGEADYSGARGDAYYVTRTRTVVVDGRQRQETYQERRIRWTPVSGRVHHDFDDVLVPASKSLGEQNPEAGGRSWDLAALEPYRPDYLAGFRAEVPAIPLEDGFAQARQLMESMLARDVRFDIGGDAQRIEHMQSRFSRITFKHILLPVWLASYRWQNRPYSVVVNGRTGAVSGERPYSIWKIALAVLIAIVVIAGVSYVVAMNQ